MHFIYILITIYAFNRILQLVIVSIDNDTGLELCFVDLYNIVHYQNLQICELILALKRKHNNGRLYMKKR